MARARNIKPSLFKNELLGNADPLLTLLFVSLWTLADKSGRLEDRPLRIKAETFPYRDNIDINGYLTQLVSLGFIWRYEIDGNHFIQVIEFVKHQSPHNTEKASVLPECPIEFRTKSATYKILALNNESAFVTSQLNVLNPDSGFTDSLNPDSLIDRKKTRPKKKQFPDDFVPCETATEKLRSAGMTVSAEVEKFKDYCQANGKTYINWQAGFRTWANNAVEWAKPKNGSPQFKSAVDRQVEMAHQMFGSITNGTGRIIDLPQD